MAKKLGDFFRNTMGVPAGKQPIEKGLIKPAQIGPQPAPQLLMTGTIDFQPPPDLYEPPAPPPHPLVPELSFPKVLSFQPSPTLSTPAPLSVQPVPQLSKPAPISSQPAPLLTAPSQTVFQPAPTLSSPKDVGSQPAPTLLSPKEMEPQPAPALLSPREIGPQPAPALLSPRETGPQPAPPLLSPKIIEVQPAPPLSSPKEMGPQPAPPLSSPKEMGPQPAPPLSLPRDIPLQAAPSLSVPKDIAPQPAPELSRPADLKKQDAPALLRRAPVSDKGSSSFIELGNIGDLWSQATDRQAAYFNEVLPKMLANLAQRSLPTPGKIDPDLLPSTIITKILNVANQRIQELENTYGYNVIANAGNKVSAVIGGALGVNYRPPGAYESQEQSVTSLQNINNELRKVPGKTLVDVFQTRPGSHNILRPQFKTSIQDDPKYSQLRTATTRYKLAVDDKEGLLDKILDVPTAAKQTYLPFYLADLRPDVNNKFRVVFFQPINLEISENFAPSWSSQNYLGRVDPVATYQNTTRNISVSFKMVALHPSDVPIIYKKIKWLTSMVYPEYAPNMRYKSGPVCKLRIGNLVNATDASQTAAQINGTPGFISGLDYAYDNLWEIEDDWQVPRGVDVSFSFTVLHELPIGVMDGEFGSIGYTQTDGIFVTPEQATAQIVPSSTQTRSRDFVDDRGFRSVGPDKPEADNRGLDIPDVGD